jgi:hypothetical protein
VFGHFHFFNKGIPVIKTLLATLLTNSLLFGTSTVLAEKKQASNAFKQEFILHGISFKVTSQGNKLRIAPSGLKIDNSPIERDIDGTVTGADIGDINIDRSPEIYVYIKDAKGGVSLLAYSANKKKSLSEIYLPPFIDNPKLSKGYRGYNDVAMVEGIIVQRFPIYKDTDRDDKPTGGTRQLQYKLTQGEANWILKLDKVLEF